MTYNFTISPDFTPDKLPGWFILNTWMQTHIKQPIHLEVYDDFGQLHKAIEQDKVDLIYANPYDAVTLVREKGFTAVVKPKGKADETAIIVSQDSPATCIEDLQQGSHLVTTTDPDVYLKGMIMLEPAELNKDNLKITKYDNYILVAKELIRGNADVGFFLEDAFNSLSAPTRSALKALLASSISLVHHILLVGPRMKSISSELTSQLIAMENDEKGKNALSSLALQGWEMISTEEMEFMIDLMDALGATDE